jgi:hypothetical protein
MEAYVFYQGMDSNGNDIVHHPNKSVEQLKTLCSANVFCKGFNSNGWLKLKINPKNTWGSWTTDPQKGLFVKRGVKIQDTTPTQDTGASGLPLTEDDRIPAKDTAKIAKQIGIGVGIIAVLGLVMYGIKKARE